jgi:hypothetical protein
MMAKHPTQVNNSTLDVIHASTSLHFDTHGQACEAPLARIPIALTFSYRGTLAAALEACMQDL